MLTVGITGQKGFIGTHLFNYLSHKENELKLIPFDDSYFDDIKILLSWVRKCDVIVHLAAMNRHEDQTVIYNTNIKLVKQLINVLEEANIAPHILFSSSSQENRENSYGKSKKEGRELFINWARKNNARFTGMVIPNVFGPSGKPFYNSVVATFCYQLTHSEKPKIDVDGTLRLIYVGELTEIIYHIIIEGKSEDEFHVLHTYEKKVSEILKILEKFKDRYIDNKMTNGTNDRFEENLFATFLSFIDPKR